MATKNVLKAAGLYTAPNELSASPEGAFIVADNVVVRDAHIIEPRLGVQDGSAAVVTGTINTLFIKNDGTVLALSSNGTFCIGGVQIATGISSAGPHRLRMEEAKDTVFLATSNGQFFIDASSGVSVLSRTGVQKAYDATTLTLNAAAGAWTWNNTNNAKVAYRLVWGFKDAVGRIFLGAPSGRSLIANTTAANRFVEVTVPFIKNPTSRHFFRVYRSEGSIGGTIDPPEDVYQVYEFKSFNPITVAGASISKSGAAVATVTFTNHGFILPGTGVLRLTVSPGDANFPAGTYAITVTGANTFTYNDGVVFTGTASVAMTYTPAEAVIKDFTPEALLGNPLYTNSTDGEGELQANTIAPKSADITWWDNRLWYSNTISKYRIDLQLVGVGGQEGLANNDTIVINNVAFTATTGAPANDFQFQLSVAATASLQVEETTKNLIKAINKTSSLLQAYYLSGANDVPGKFLVEEINVGGAVFAVYATDASIPSQSYAWAPFLPSTSGTAISATNDAAVNRLFYSKLDQPEAVPLLNYIDIGEKNKNILRIYALNEELFVFKEDGIFIISSSFPYRVRLFDPTCILVWYDSLANLGNQIYGLTNQGVVTVNNSGVGIVGRAVEDMFIVAMRTRKTGTPRAFGVADEIEHQYQLFFDTSNIFNDPTEALVYNALGTGGGVWTHFTYGASHGVPNTSFATAGLEKTTLILGKSSSNLLLTPISVIDNFVPQRSIENYVDGSLSRNILSFSGATITLDSGSSIQIGDVIKQVGGVIALITNVAGAVLTVSSASGTPIVGVCDIGRSYLCKVVWVAQTADSPESMKHFREGNILFKNRRYLLDPEMLFASDLSTTSEAINLTFSGSVLPPASSSFIRLDYETGQIPRNKRVLVPKDKQRCNYLTVGFQSRQAYGYFALHGYSVDFEFMSERGNK